MADHPIPAALTIEQHGQPDRRLVLHGSLYRIGRDSSSELVLDQQAVSRRHALLERYQNRWLLSDSGSTNGLWWQGRQVTSLLLQDGDRVRFGPPDQTDLPLISFHAPGRRRRKQLLRLVLLGLAGLAGGGLLLLLLGLATLPIRGSLASVRGPLLLYDRADRPIATADDRRHREQRGLEGYPQLLIDALLASEDSRFWWHPGIDPIGTGRALVANLIGGRVLEGGSTLTQQLARSLYPAQVGQGETLARKWRELLVALQLEARFSKGELLLSYLNRAFLGVGWGFEDASRRLFGKPALRLEVEEAALLVGLLSSPYGHDPCSSPQAALEARNAVLHKMVDSGRLAADPGRAARRRPIRLAADACRASSRRALPYYSDQVRRDLDAMVGADVAAEGNYLVGTHLDPALQELIERLLRDHLDASRGLGVAEGAVVVLDSRNGGILAIVGGRDYRQSQFNRASMALRQPGSTFKLVPYTVAIERGARPGDLVSCAPLRWQGQYFDSGCGGSISLRQALAISSNTAALRLARRVGLEAVVHKARDLGFTTPLNTVPGLALGQSEVTLVELTAAYAAVADQGLWHAPSTIRQLTDAEGCSAAMAEKGCRQNQPPASAPAKAKTPAQAQAPARAPAAPGGDGGSAGRRAMTAATAKTLQELLRGVVNGGTGSAAWVGADSWGKTGTTNDGRDLLFVGAVPARHWVMGVWLGNDDNSPSRSTSHLAAELWGQIVRSSTASP
jgi:membrane peptidoglycan carboxypeptidase